MEKNEIIKENIKKSKRKYGERYNKENITIQLNRELIDRLKEKIETTTVKSYIENLILSDLSN